jgi:hypothetical protein
LVEAGRANVALSNPLKQILNIRREEIPQALLMSSYFFLVITSFWILKPLKKSLFIQYYAESGFDLLSWTLTAAQADSWPRLSTCLSLSSRQPRSRISPSAFGVSN